MTTLAEPAEVISFAFVEPDRALIVPAVLVVAGIKFLEYRSKRHTGFVIDAVLEMAGGARLTAEAAFDLILRKILVAAAEKVDEDQFDDAGRVILTLKELPPLVVNDEIQR